MRHWVDTYPHTVTASVLLLDGKIYNWKIGNQNWKDPGKASMRVADMHYVNEGRFTVENKYFEVHNRKEHDEVFDILAKQWFRNWEISEIHYGQKSY